MFASGTRNLAQTQSAVLLVEKVGLFLLHRPAACVYARRDGDRLPYRTSKQLDRTLGITR